MSKVLLVRMVPLANRGRRVILALLVRQGLKVKLVLRDPLDRLGQRAPRVLLVLWDLRGPWARQARREMMVRALPFLEVMKMKKLCVKRILQGTLVMRILCRETCTFGRKRKAIGIT